MEGYRMIGNETTNGCGEVCTDNRFGLIEKYKQELIGRTNIETSKDEMAVLDGILFRLWQVRWLDKLEKYDEAIEALKKQEPKKPVKKANDFNDITFYCPSCDKPIGLLFGGEMFTKYCRFCGQSLECED